MAGERPELLVEGVQKELIEIMYACLEFEEDKRPTFEGLSNMLNELFESN